MKVKKIELVGFKSFADRTEIHLGEGVTCVVGPNGCGKSNLSDAIRWVFGERSAKLLRGTRMEDVIFAGTDLRKPMGLAEVSFTLDNSDHALPIEYEEVVLTRRMDRTSQSQYFINRTPCRLRDILDLIRDTGMGSNSYSMIEQGRVDHVINADPEERRFLIEEAAGISKYKAKKEEALRKLERTEQNLLRIRDIRTEVQRNIQYAEKQARRAERYKAQFEELKNLEIRKALLELAQRGEEKKNLEAEKQEISARLQGLEASLAALQGQAKDQKSILDEALRREQGQSAHLFDLKSQIQALIQKQEFDEERFREGERRLAEIKKEEELLEVQEAQLESETSHRAEERRDSDEAYQKTHEALGEEKKRFEEIEADCLVKKQRQEALKNLLFQKASRLAQFRNEGGRLRALEERMARDQNRRREQLAQLSGDEKQIRQGASGNIPSLRKELREIEERIGEKQLAYQEALSRVKLLEELEESQETAQRKLIASISAGRSLQGKLIRSLREVLQIKAGYESAVEAVLGSLAQGLVAEDVETAQGLLLEMQQAHLGPCAILIQSLIKPNGRTEPSLPPTHSKIKLSIQDVVEIQKGYEPLFEPLFENAYVVEDFSPDHLGELLPLTERSRLVTREGILLGPEARVFFRNGRLSPDQGPFGRAAEIQALKKRAAHCEEEVKELHQRREGHEKELRHQESEEERWARGEEEARILASEIAETEKEGSELQRKLETTQKEILADEEEERSLTREQMQVELALAALQKTREDLIHSLSRLKTLLESREERLEGIRSTEALVKDQREKIKERRLRLKEEAALLQDRLGEIQKGKGEYLRQHEALEEEKNHSEQALRETQIQKGVLEERYRFSADALNEKENQRREAFQKLHETELKLVEFVYEEGKVNDRIEQGYRVKLSELRREDFLTEGDDQVKLEERITFIKEKVESLGAVNLLAVEEYEELKQRFDFLSAQERDLEEARTSLLDAIRKINRTTQTLFEETFTKAQALFEEYFQTLFGGGHAELRRVEDEESQSEGIDILVRPPGKKLQHISLLSGGEKALTAVALLFALFRIKPSPLCVLDEVDAPLDEANVDRFLQVLRTFLQSTQFFIVTHNRKTIAMGDFLYGVTMEESGVSKIVSVKVAESSAAPSNRTEALAAS